MLAATSAANAAASIYRAPSRTIASNSDELTAEPLLAFGSLPSWTTSSMGRTFPNRRANAGPDQTSMGFRSSAGKVRPPRHLTQGYPQVLIIAFNVITASLWPNIRCMSFTDAQTRSLTTPRCVGGRGA
jgi:hypothetical protein